MKPTFSLLLVLLFNYCNAQEDPSPIGYKLTAPLNFITVYRDKNAKPDETVFNFWNTKYWFKVDEATPPAKINGKDFIRVTIPSKLTWDTTTKKYLPDPHYTTEQSWTQNGVHIDSEDFNSWLWISKDDFEKYKVPYYGRVSFQFVLSGITVPFKFRPTLHETNSTQLNGSVDIGTFTGARLPLEDKGGISIGVSLGLTSITTTSANNSAITEKNSSQTMAGVTYGWGVVFDWAKSFQLGVLMGYDHGTGDFSSTYYYQDKPWFALSLNYKFLSFLKSTPQGKNESSK